MSYAEAPESIRTAVEDLIRNYGSDPALLAGAIVSATMRAIMAAKAEEREAIARYHDEACQELNRLALKFEDSGNKTQADRCITRSSVHAISAQTIRKRGEG